MFQETPADIHAGCQSAYEREKRRADFAEARIKAMKGDLATLAQKMDRIGGHNVYTEFSSADNPRGKTLGGAVRQITYWHSD